MHVVLESRKTASTSPYISTALLSQWCITLFHSSMRVWSGVWCYGMVWGDVQCKEQYVVLQGDVRYYRGVLYGLVLCQHDTS